MAVSRQNSFARVETLAKLDEVFEIMVSPENLYADGERSHAEAQRLYRRLVQDYQHRQSELRLAALNAERTNAQKAASATDAMVDKARQRMQDH